MFYSLLLHIHIYHYCSATLSISCDSGFADISLLRLTQLASIESYCVDSLPGPEHCVEPSSCNPNHCPAFQHLGEHLYSQHNTQTMKLKQNLQN